MLYSAFSTSGFRQPRTKRLQASSLHLSLSARSRNPNPNPNPNPSRARRKRQSRRRAKERQTQDSRLKSHCAATGSPEKKIQAPVPSHPWHLRRTETNLGSVAVCMYLYLGRDLCCTRTCAGACNAQILYPPHLHPDPNSSRRLSSASQLGLTSLPKPTILYLNCESRPSLFSFPLCQPTATFQLRAALRHCESRYSIKHPTILIRAACRASLSSSAPHVGYSCALDVASSSPAAVAVILQLSKTRTASPWHCPAQAFDSRPRRPSPASGKRPADASSRRHEHHLPAGAGRLRQPCPAIIHVGNCPPQQAKDRGRGWLQRCSAVWSISCSPAKPAPTPTPDSPLADSARTASQHSL